MTRDDKIVATVWSGFALLILLIIGGGCWWEWYVAGQQAEVYAQQGVTITRWQVLIGVKPAPALQGKRP